MSETRACPGCAALAPQAAKFCPECGTRLDGGVPAAEVRKVVSLLFCDLVGSTALGERLDPEAFRRVQLGYYATCEGALQRHGGTIEKFIGDAVFCAFGVPVTHEDDALRACRAALDLIAGIRNLNVQLDAEWGVQLSVRIGVNTGTVVVGERSQGGLGVTGDAVNTAARLEQAAGSDEVLIGATTRALVGDRAVCVPVEPLELKGKGEPVPAWRLVDMDVIRPAGPARTSSDPLVGRKDELGRIEAWLASSLGGAGMCLVLGGAGIGKSRLLAEVVARTSRPTYWGRCPPYGEEITYRLLADWLEVLGDDLVEGAIGSRDVDRLRFATERGNTPATVEEIGDAAGALLRALGRSTDLLLLAEDVHWAEPSMLDLLVSLSGIEGVAVVATARPELLEARPDLARGRLDVRVELAPLDPVAAGELLQGATSDLAGTGLERVIAEAEGNPLMILQLARHLAEGGDPDKLPPRLEAVLQARVDRLSADERSVAERAAVMGREFWDSAVEALAPEAASPAAALSLLARRDFVAAGRADGAPDVVSPTLSGVFSAGAASPYSFTHALLRDTVYESTPKLRRADLHERLGRLLVESGAGDELVALHFERAARMRAELRPHERDDLAARAAEHLERAGDRALARRDNEAARALLTRAAALLDDDTARDRIHASIAATELATGKVELVPGDVVSGYQVRGVAGRGGMGVVYRAEDLALGREVALKVIAPALARDPRFRQRFARESRIAAGLEHPNVVPVYRAGEENGQLYIAMRFVEGTDLQLLLRDGPLTPARAAAIVAQVGEALDAAHARGLVHRDVKPANVLVAGTGGSEQAFLTDFGLTRDVEGGDGLTKTGQWVGTLAYVAPEQIRGEPVDARADIYALGAVLYQCLTGEPPFPVESELEALAAHLDEPPPRPSRNGAPRALDGVVERAMSKDPSRRFRSAGDLGRAAAAAVGGERGRLSERSVATGAAAPVEAGRRKRRRSRRGTVLVGVGSGVVVAGIAVATALAVGVLTAGSGGGSAADGDLAVGPAVKLSQSPDRIAVLGKEVWALQDDLGRMARLDPASGEVAYFTAPIDLGGGSFPDLASGFDQLWVAHAQPSLGGIDRIDPETGQGVAHVSLPSARAVTTGARWTWATATEGSAGGVLIRIDPGSNRKLGAPVRVGGAPVAVAEQAGSVWVADRASDRVIRVSASSRRITARVDVGDEPGQLAVFPDAIWVANFGDRTLSRIDPKTNRVVGAAISLGKEIDAIAGTRDGLWVASADDTLTRLDPATGDVIGAPLALGTKHPFSLGSDGRTLWIGSVGDRTLQRLLGL